MPTKSHKCTRIPGGIEATRGAGKLVQGPAGEPCAHGLGEGREAVVPNTVEAYGEPQNRNGEVTPGDRQHKAAAGRARGEPRGPSLVFAFLMLCGARTPLPQLTGPPLPPRAHLSNHQAKVRWVIGWHTNRSLWKVFGRHRPVASSRAAAWPASWD